MRVVLRVGVHSVRGLREGIPNLMRLFHEYQVRASFFFPLGIEDSGRSPAYAWRRVRRDGWQAMLRGTLLPAPDLSRGAANLISQARENGHEVGVFGMSPRIWASLGYLDEGRIAAECQALWDAALRHFGEDTVPLAVPGWQTAPALLRDLSKRYCSYTAMTRGKFPYRPVLQGQRTDVIEIPTTLPTADELLKMPDVNDDNVHEFLYAESQRVRPAGHVYAASAEREGIDLYPLMEKMLVMWRGQDSVGRVLGDLLGEIRVEMVPTHQVGWDMPPGADTAVATQSLEVPR